MAGRPNGLKRWDRRDLGPAAQKTITSVHSRSVTYGLTSPLRNTPEPVQVAHFEMGENSGPQADARVTRVRGRSGCEH
jgi:hypothetical protein